MYLDYKHILHFLFPPSEDEVHIMGMVTKDFLLIGRKETNAHITSLLPYNDARVRSAIHLLKFHNHTHARELLAATLGEYFNSLDTAVPYVCIPVPLSKERLRTRGYNQVSEVIQESRRTTAPIEFSEKILLRTHNTPPQTSLSRKERLTNVSNAFVAKNNTSTEAFLAGKHILLVDDVMTTGATLQAAKAALLPLEPVSITCVALAH